MTCQRCGEHAATSICSTFTIEQICLACKGREESHPDYERARQAEADAVRGGDYNFPGIGKPADL